MNVVDYFNFVNFRSNSCAFLNMVDMRRGGMIIKRPAPPPPAFGAKMAFLDDKTLMNQQRGGLSWLVRVAKRWEESNFVDINKKKPGAETTFEAFQKNSANFAWAAIHPCGVVIKYVA